MLFYVRTVQYTRRVLAVGVWWWTDEIASSEERKLRSHFATDKKIHTSIFYPENTTHWFLSLKPKGVSLVITIHGAAPKHNGKLLLWNRTFVILWLKCKWTWWKCGSTRICTSWAIYIYIYLRNYLVGPLTVKNSINKCFLQGTKQETFISSPQSADPQDWAGRRRFNLKVERYQCDNLLLSDRIYLRNDDITLTQSR